MKLLTTTLLTLLAALATASPLGDENNSQPQPRRLPTSGSSSSESSQAASSTPDSIRIRPIPWSVRGPEPKGSAQLPTIPPPRLYPYTTALYGRRLRWAIY